jgi:hypothetical protein
MVVDSETELKEGMKEHSEQAKTLEEAINLASLELDDRKK